MEVVDEAEEPVTDEDGHVGLPSSYRLSVDDRHLLLTTGAAPFLECQMHSAKTPKHSGKASPSEGLPGKRSMGKRPSPSAKYRALGEAFLECRAPSR
jgi:hypothetical protein